MSGILLKINPEKCTKFKKLVTSMDDLNKFKMTPIKNFNNKEEVTFETFSVDLNENMKIIAEQTEHPASNSKYWHYTSNYVSFWWGQMEILICTYLYFPPDLLPRNLFVKGRNFLPQLLPNTLPYHK